MSVAIKVRTPDVIADFAKIVESHVAKGTDPGTIMAALQRVKAKNPTIYKEKQMSEFLKAKTKALNSLLGSYILARLSQSFGLLNRDLFLLKRHVIVTKDKKISYDSTRAPADKSKNILRYEIPMFCVAGLDDSKIQLGQISVRHSKTTNWRREYKTQKHKLMASVPEIPEKIRRLGTKAIGTYFKIIGEIHSHDDLCDLDIQFHKPKLEVIWIPMPESMNLKTEEKIVYRRIDPDPALVMSIGEQSFLVTLWNSKDEEPFEHVLREFSEGIFPTKGA